MSDQKEFEEEIRLRVSDDTSGDSSASSQAGGPSSGVSDKVVGTTVATNYEIIKKIGEGGMSQVYLADHKLLDAKFAIKFISSSLIGDEKSMVRFQTEAKAACQLNHSNICTVREFGISDNDRPFMVMDFVKGKSLYEILEEVEKLPVDRALDILIKVCEGLVYAHGKGVIHRDIKPHNIMLYEENDTADNVMIVDFGIAKIIRDDKNGPNLTQTGEVFGTPNYMSPEQCQGQPVSQRSDIYSLGCMLYEMIVGRAPFTGNNSFDTLMNHVNKTYERLNEIPLPLNIILERCLAKDPDDRFESVEALKQDLEAFRKGEDIKALPVKRKLPVKFIMILSTMLVLGVMGIFAGWMFSQKSMVDVPPWEHLKARAVAERDRGNYDESISLIKKAIASAKSNKQPKDVLGSLYKTYGDFLSSSKRQKAIEIYKESKNLYLEAKDYKNYELVMASMLAVDQKTGIYRLLVNHTDELLKNLESWYGKDSPRRMLALNYRGFAKWTISEERHESDPCFREVIRLGKINPPTKQNLKAVSYAHMQLGNHFFERAKYKESMDEYKKALAIAKKADAGYDRYSKIESLMDEVKIKMLTSRSTLDK